jgi:RNA polymerase sigma-70 factor (ECF subfamily)
VQDDLYQRAAEEHRLALERVSRAYEADPDKRRDLLQEIHLQVWRSFANFDSRCSVRTWVYRVAHNAAASYVIREKRSALVSIEDLEARPGEDRLESEGSRQHALERLAELIRQLKPLDRQVIVAYLEGLDAAAISEMTGLSPANVAMKVHRIKNVLARQFHQGGIDAEQQ